MSPTWIPPNVPGGTPITSKYTSEQTLEKLTFIRDINNFNPETYRQTTTNSWTFALSPCFFRSFHSPFSPIGPVVAPVGIPSTPPRASRCAPRTSRRWPPQRHKACWGYHDINDIINIPLICGYYMDIPLI
jgi:hypothetical protein